MKYLFENEALNPVSTEKYLKLPRESVKSVTIFNTGAVEIDIPGDISEDPVKKQALTALLTKHGLPRGKKARQ